MLEQLVFSRMYFDPEGLILAEADGQPVGFVHAGFGPTDDGSELSTEMGVTCMLQVVRHESRQQIEDELLARSEAYLRERGARILYGGEVYPLNPFYLGLYGGSELPGVLESHASLSELFRRSSYREIDSCDVFQIALDGFRVPISRKLMLARRQYLVEATYEPAPRTWWQACTTPASESVRFQVRPRDSDQACGDVTFWEIEPLGTSWGVTSVGMVRLQIDESRRRQGLATMLLDEALRQLVDSGVERVEVQTMRHNEAARALYQNLGFLQVDRGLVFRKE